MRCVALVRRHSRRRMVSRRHQEAGTRGDLRIGRLSKLACLQLSQLPFRVGPGHRARTRPCIAPSRPVGVPSTPLQLLRQSPSVILGGGATHLIAIEPMPSGGRTRLRRFGHELTAWAATPRQWTSPTAALISPGRSQACRRHRVPDQSCSSNSRLCGLRHCRSGLAQPVLRPRRCSSPRSMRGPDPRRLMEPEYTRS